ncbi:nitrous oxide-stimulated promoter family protein [Alkalibacter rhizosphaerae]|uniref:Nitrous oxide-stimulated promoter family protein n=1 Tax=Alkalibacter rhizosphaerae TaxID=2815577 RepID=A0A974XEU7_9FIRM|nr:nitrous oxide-stimulated promoter family protein [Alkalibacter rhizosphaerae]QSX08456.1 nitrous oxide-stimulated promoter family protein [Alkalibacter rhizosphaerae]
MDPAKEKRIFETMTIIYCTKHHAGRSPCPSCGNLITYAWQRIDHCPHGSAKPFCSKCSIHCFHPNERQKVKNVMRYSGPRMIFHSPLDAFRHLFSR